MEWHGKASRKRKREDHQWNRSVKQRVHTDNAAGATHVHREDKYDSVNEEIHHLADELCNASLYTTDVEIFSGTVMKVCDKKENQETKEDGMMGLADWMSPPDLGYFGFIRVSDLSREVIFHSDRVLSDFGLRLQKDDFVEVRVSRRTLKLAEAHSNIKKPKADYVRITKYSAEQNFDKETTEGSRQDTGDVLPSRGLAILFDENASVKRHVDAKTAGKAFWALCGDEAAKFLRLGFRRNLPCNARSQICTSVNLALKVAMGAGSSEQGSSSLEMFLRIRDGFLRPPKNEVMAPGRHARCRSGLELKPRKTESGPHGEHGCRDSQRISEFDRRIAFLLTILVDPERKWQREGALPDLVHRGVEELIKPLCLVCIQRNPLLWEGFVKPFVAALRSNFVASICYDHFRRASRHVVEAVEKSVQDLAASINEEIVSLLVNQRVREMGCAGDLPLFAQHGWQPLADKPSVRELQNAQTLFDDLHEARVQKDRPYMGREHYMRVYAQLFRVEAYSALTKSVAKAIAGTPTTFYDTKVYQAHVKGFYLPKGPSRGKLGLALRVEPEFQLYCKEPFKFKQTWVKHALLPGTLLALSFDGKFAKRENLVYLICEIRDQEQLLRDGLVVGSLLYDWNSALQPDNGGETAGEGPIAKLRGVLARNAGSACRLVENPSFFTASGPALAALTSRSSIPFEDVIVHCDFHAIHVAMRDDIPLYRPPDGKTHSFSRELVMKVHTQGQNTLGAPFMTVAEYLAELRNPGSSLRSESELHLEQLEAIAHMLVAKVAVIVGVPGTGKSFIAVRQVRILRQIEPNAKVLLLSYKNHATDEFASDVLDAGIPIVRVGGRCKDDRLRDYTLGAILKRDEWEQGNDNEACQRHLDLNRCMEQLEAAMWKHNELSFCDFKTLASCISISQLTLFFQGYCKSMRSWRLRSRDNVADAKYVEERIIPCLQELANILQSTEANSKAEPTLLELVMSCRSIDQERTENAESIKHILGTRIDRLLGIFAKAFSSWMPELEVHQELRQRELDPMFGITPSAAFSCDSEVDNSNEKAMGEDDEQSDTELEKLDRQELLNQVHTTSDINDKAVEQRLIIPCSGSKLSASSNADTCPFFPEISNSSKLQSREEKKRLLQHPNLWKLSAEDRCRFIHAAVELCLESSDLMVAEVHRKMEVAAHMKKLAQDKRKVLALTQPRHLGEWVVNVYGKRFFQNSDVTAQVPVVAMTIDGASIQANVVQDCEFDYVFIEEAAEQLEAKLVACLPHSLKGLCLIGDPDQLPPKPDTHVLSQHYDFAVSMMERLVANGFPVARMMRQSRMHPDISYYSLKKYNKLENHLPSVANLERFMGFPHRVWFWDTGPGDREQKTTSISNAEEAERAICVAQFLILNNVDPGRIAILATYKGQVRLIRSLVKSTAEQKIGIEAFFDRMWDDRASPFTKRSTIRDKIKNIRWHDPAVGRIEDYDEAGLDERVTYSVFDEVTIDTVDNFQGDQNDYIIGSFTRSNSVHRCGFLKAQEGSQRLNVMLTRARCLLVLIGDRECLEYDFRAIGRDPVTHERVYDTASRHPNVVFKDLFSDLDKSNAASLELPVRCPRHSQFAAVCHSAEGFAQGKFQCRIACGKMRACQHACQQPCHGGECRSRCEAPVTSHCRVNPAHPPWNTTCWQSATERCPALVKFDCKRCQDPSLFQDVYIRLSKRQSEVRNTILTRKCYQRETEVHCPTRFAYKCLDGAHKYERSCGEDEQRCMKPSTRKLKCGHMSRKTCWQKFCDDRSIEPQAEELCLQIVKEICADCCVGEIERVCSEKKPKSPCMQLVPHRCPVCDQLGQRRCGTHPHNFVCQANVYEKCSRCGEFGKKICGKDLICEQRWLERCLKCGQMAQRSCGVKFQCTTQEQIHCKKCEVLLQTYTCHQGPPHALPLCTASVHFFCTRCDTMGTKPCASPATEFVCQAPCKRILKKCRHRCMRQCGLPCAQSAEECRECALDKTKEWLYRGSYGREPSRKPGERVLLPIWKLEFTQASCSLQMRSGRSLDDERQDILLHHPERLLPDNFEKSYATLNVFCWKESPGRVRYMSLDNRRLALLKQCRPGGRVYVRISDDLADFHRKYQPKLRQGLQPDEINIRDHVMRRDRASGEQNRT